MNKNLCINGFLLIFKIYFHNIRGTPHCLRITDLDYADHTLYNGVWNASDLYGFIVCKHKVGSLYFRGITTYIKTCLYPSTPILSLNVRFAVYLQFISCVV
jgi:hypothetical protein